MQNICKEKKKGGTRKLYEKYKICVRRERKIMICIIIMDIVHSLWIEEKEFKKAVVSRMIMQNCVIDAAEREK